MAPAKLRGTLNVLFQLFITIGGPHQTHRSISTCMLACQQPAVVELQLQCSDVMGRDK